MYSSNLSVCKHQNTCFIKCKDSGTHLNSPQFRGYCEKIVMKDKSIKRVVLDLSEIDYMDSTFIGTILIIFRELEENSIKFTLNNPSKKGIYHLETMGLDKIIEITHERIPESSLFEDIGICMLSDKEREILEAHLALCDISEENRKRFSLLTKVLEKDLKEKNMY